MSAYRESRTRFRYLLENACLVGACILIWATIAGGVWIVQAAGGGSPDISGIVDDDTSTVEDQGSLGPDGTWTDRHGYTCSYSDVDVVDLCPENPLAP